MWEHGGEQVYGAKIEEVWVSLSVSNTEFSLASSLSHTFDSVKVDDMPVRRL